MTSGAPSAPWRWAPWPWPPRCARKCALRRKDWRSRRLSSQRSTTSPPRPPSPPSGPPLGTCASRRNDRQPFPPPPARTSILALSASIPGNGRAMAPDPVFLITGASTGIGAETARQAAAAGYRLVLAARSEDKLEALAGELPEAIAVRCDVTEWEDQQALVARALDEYGRIDVAFANAGFGGPRGFGEGDVEHWKAMVLTNVYGAALTIRATREALIERKGHLLLTGSVAGRRALQGSLYSATKWAVTGMGESARQDFNDTGVRVTLIEPGMVDTPFFDDPPKIEALHAEDVARAVIFAVSQPSRVDVNEILIRPTDQPA